MAVLLKGGAVFLHVPKTGGSWVHKVLKESGLSVGSFDHKHADFDRVLANRCELGCRQALRILGEQTIWRSQGPFRLSNGFRFCFVRHPLSWYESYWKFMTGKSWRDWGRENSRPMWHPNSVLNGLSDDDFNGFMHKVITKRPGYVSELFAAFTKSGINFIGKCEGMADDLLTVLRHLELPHDEQKIRDFKRVNVSADPARQIEWDPALRTMALRLDLAALVHYDYLTEPDRELLGVTMPLAPNPALQKIFTGRTA